MKISTLAYAAAIFLILMLGNAKADELDHPIEGMAVIVGTMAACSQARSDLGSHCQIIMGPTAIITAVTEDPWWGFGIGCGITILKEILDHNTEGSVSDPEDAKYGCGSAALISYGTNSIIKFYNVRNTPTLGIQKPF